MKMTHETDVLKGKNADLLNILDELRSYLHDAAHEGTALHAVEHAVWREVLKLGATLLGQFFELVGPGDLGESITLPDGRVCQRLDAVHERRYVSVFGEFQLQRHVYGSREGQKIEFVPLDNRLQLPEGAFSYLLQDWDQSLCVEQAFSQAGQTLQRMLGLKQSVDSLEHMNAHMATAVEEFREQRPRPDAADEGEVLVTSADGKGVVMRRAAGEERPPVHRTKGDKASRKQMAIVGAVYSVNRYVRSADDVVAALFNDERVTAPAARPTPCHKQTIASLAYTDSEGEHSGIDKTYTWLLEELWRRNHGFDKEMVHLCDGQDALWCARVRCLPTRNTMDILDLLHVTPRLWVAAHLFYPEKSRAAEQFVRERVHKVLEGQVKLVVRGLREMGTKRGLTGSKKATLESVCAFFENNYERMRYDEYLAKGYPIATGVIEGACHHLVKDRMERAGMHWTRPGAQAMLDVRSIAVNGDWDAYQQYYFNSEMRKLYPWRVLVEGPQFTLAA